MRPETRVRAAAAKRLAKVRYRDVYACAERLGVSVSEARSILGIAEVPRRGRPRKMN